MTTLTNGSIAGLIPGSGVLRDRDGEYPIIGYASIVSWHNCEQCEGDGDSCRAKMEVRSVVPIIIDPVTGWPEVATFGERPGSCVIPGGME